MRNAKVMHLQHRLRDLNSDFSDDPDFSDKFIKSTCKFVFCLNLPMPTFKNSFSLSFFYYTLKSEYVTQIEKAD
jgi:hypothetical protein